MIEDALALALLLGASWKICSTDVQDDLRAFQVVLEHPGGATCPECGKNCPISEYSDLRSWKMSPIGDFDFFVHTRVPRLDCPTDGQVLVDTPWERLEGAMPLFKA